MTVVNSWLDCLLRSADLNDLSAVRHPLGFLCIPVHRAVERGLCIHIWTRDVAGSELTTSPMHAHTWDLTSYVLLGQVRNDLIWVDEETKSPTHRIFAVYPHGRTDEVRWTPRMVRYRTTATRLISRGETYRIPAGTFHTTSASDVAATIVMAENRLPPPELALGDITQRTCIVTRGQGDANDMRVAAKILGTGYFGSEPFLGE